MRFGWRWSPESIESLHRHHHHFFATTMAATNMDNTKWNEAVLSVLKGTVKKSKKDDKNVDHNETLKVKSLRKLVLVSLQLDEDDKAARKTFKRTIQALEQDGSVHLDADGNITLVKKRKRKEEGKSKKKTKLPVVDDDDDDDDDEGSDAKQTASTASQPQNTADNISSSASSTQKNAPCKGNPQGVTRLFLGNLPFAVDETMLETFIPGLTHVKWITDKATGKFYGSAFVEMTNSTAAASAVAKAGLLLLDRPVKINFAPALPGDKWPPEKRVVTGGATATNTNTATATTSAKAGGRGLSAMSAKPDNCLKLFIGNLSYDIDDDGITKFFASVDAEVKAVRWIHHKDTGDFKGVYVVLQYLGTM
jgi:RNA recognition motif-containing protein